MLWVGLPSEDAACGLVHPQVPHMKDKNNHEISCFQFHVKILDICKIFVESFSSGIL